MTDRHQRLRLQSHAPDVPPYSQHRPSLALAYLDSEAGIQHWTALTIDHHLALDTLVLRRSENNASPGGPALPSGNGRRRPTRTRRSVQQRSSNTALSNTFGLSSCVLASVNKATNGYCAEFGTKQRWVRIGRA